MLAQGEATHAEARAEVRQEARPEEQMRANRPLLCVDQVGAPALSSLCVQVQKPPCQVNPQSPWLLDPLVPGQQAPVGAPVVPIWPGTEVDREESHMTILLAVHPPLW